MFDVFYKQTLYKNSIKQTNWTSAVFLVGPSEPADSAGSGLFFICGW